MADRYDVILLGINVEDSERDAAISNIATVLAVNEREIRHLADNKISAPVKQGISIESARKYQRDILRLGGICNFRPSSQVFRTLELAPIEVPREGVVFSCPACGFKQEVPSAKDIPLQCPQCGIIPSKYDKIAANTEDREKIKRHLLNAPKRKQQDPEPAER